MLNLKELTKEWPSTKMTTMPTKEKIIVALDVPSAEAALRVAQKLHGHVGMFKVGKELFTAAGPP